MTSEEIEFLSKVRAEFLDQQRHCYSSFQRNNLQWFLERLKEIMEKYKNPDLK